MRKRSRLRLAVSVPLYVAKLPYRVVRNRWDRRRIMQPFARKRFRLIFWRSDHRLRRARVLWDLMYETPGLNHFLASELLKLLPYLLPAGKNRQIRLRRVNDEGEQFIEWHWIKGKRRGDA